MKRKLRIQDLNFDKHYTHNTVRNNKSELSVKHAQFFFQTQTTQTFIKKNVKTISGMKYFTQHEKIQSYTLAGFIKYPSI